LDLLVNLRDCFCGIDSYAIIPLLETLHDRQGLIGEGIQPFLNSFGVIVCPSAGFGSLHDTVDQYFGGTVEIDQITDDYRVPELLLELDPVLLVPGKPVKQISAIAVC
jgi:hypothetical protein